MLFTVYFYTFLLTAVLFSCIIKRRKECNTVAKFHLDENYLGREPLKIKDFYLIQLGRMYCEEGQEDGLHRHDELFEWTVVTGGEGVITTNGVATKVTRGDIYLSFPYELHQITSSQHAPLQFDFFAFRPTPTHFQKEFTEIAEKYPPDRRVFTDERVEGLLSEAIAEFLNKQQNYEELLYCQFREILLYTLRAFYAMQTPARTVNTAQPNAFCYQMMNYIDTHVYSMKTLQELATAFNYNYSYLSALFSAATGDSLSAYHRKKKLETAAALLCAENWSVTQIAELLHYSSPYAFSRAFKDMYGVSPKQFMQRKK